MCRHTPDHLEKKYAKCKPGNSSLCKSITWPIRLIKRSPLQTSDLNIVQPVVRNFVLVRAFKSDGVIDVNGLTRLSGKKCPIDSGCVYNIFLGAGNRHTFQRRGGKCAAVPAF